MRKLDYATTNLIVIQTIKEYVGLNMSKVRNEIANLTTQQAFELYDILFPYAKENGISPDNQQSRCLIVDFIYSVI